MEFDLIKEEIDAIDSLIDEGQQKYNWNSLGTVIVTHELLIGDSRLPKD